MTMQHEVSLSELPVFAKAVTQQLTSPCAICLHGGLGAGKTTFSKELIKALVNYKGDVPSPTYTLVQSYEGDNLVVNHFDLYRLKYEEELFELGFEELLTDSVNLIEWPEKALPYISVKVFHIYIKEAKIEKNKRIFTLEGFDHNFYA